MEYSPGPKECHRGVGEEREPGLDALCPAPLPAAAGRLPPGGPQLLGRESRGRKHENASLSAPTAPPGSPKARELAKQQGRGTSFQIQG